MKNLRNMLKKLSFNTIYDVKMKFLYLNYIIYWFPKVLVTYTHTHKRAKTGAEEKVDNNSNSQKK